MSANDGKQAAEGFTVECAMSLRLRDLIDELESSPARVVRGLAMQMGIPLQYDLGGKRSKDVLAAHIFEEIRQRKERGQ